MYQASPLTDLKDNGLSLSEQTDKEHRSSLRPHVPGPLNNLIGKDLSLYLYQLTEESGPRSTIVY